MRQVTANAINAFYNKDTWGGGNTMVTFERHTSTLLLFGNPIAIYNHRSKWLTITTAGWDTVTTRERLNGLRGVKVQRIKKVLHLNGEPWDGEPTIVEAS